METYQTIPIMFVDEASADNFIIICKARGIPSNHLSKHLNPTDKTCTVYVELFYNEDILEGILRKDYKIEEEFMKKVFKDGLSCRMPLTDDDKSYFKEWCKTLMDVVNTTSVYNEEESLTLLEQLQLMTEEFYERNIPDISYEKMVILAQIYEYENMGGFCSKGSDENLKCLSNSIAFNETTGEVFLNPHGIYDLVVDHMGKTLAFGGVQSDEEDYEYPSDEYEEDDFESEDDD